MGDCLFLPLLSSVLFQSQLGDYFFNGKFPWVSLLFELLSGRVKLSQAQAGMEVCYHAMVSSPNLAGSHGGDQVWSWLKSVFPR